MALLHTLLVFRKKRPLALHLCHVDHGWREESANEAQLLRGMAEAEGLPFHFKRLGALCETSNLEAAARSERLRFFRQVVAETGAQAVLLGHHAGDQSETVLKRILEGARVARLSGMRPSSMCEGVRLWRPLLTVAKQELLDLLESKGIPYFVDRTNEDTRFLRARMRQAIVPDLEARFGKQVQKSLCRVAEELSEWGEFIEERAQQLRSQACVCEDALVWDWSEGQEPKLCEVKALVRLLADEMQLDLRAEHLRTIGEAWAARKAHVHMWIGADLEVDRRRLILGQRSGP